LLYISDFPNPVLRLLCVYLGIQLSGQLEMSEARCEALELASKQAQLALGMMSSRAQSRSASTSSMALGGLRPTEPAPAKASHQLMASAPPEGSDEVSKKLAALTGDRNVLASLTEAELENLITVHQNALVASQSEFA
jgi:hypothetical protein